MPTLKHNICEYREQERTKNVSSSGLPPSLALLFLSLINCKPQKIVLLFVWRKSQEKKGKASSNYFKSIALIIVSLIQIHKGVSGHSDASCSVKKRPSSKYSGMGKIATSETLWTQTRHGPEGIVSGRQPDAVYIGRFASPTAGPTHNLIWTFKKLQDFGSTFFLVFPLCLTMWNILCT